jgi:hypothetical protein
MAASPPAPTPMSAAATQPAGKLLARDWLASDHRRRADQELTANGDTPPNHGVSRIPLNSCSFLFLTRKSLISKTWWAVQDSNLRPPACKAGALTS